MHAILRAAKEPNALVGSKMAEDSTRYLVYLGSNAEAESRIFIPWIGIIYYFIF